MSTHRIDLSPAEPPEGTRAHCTCGDWARSYRTHDEWSGTLDDARRHVASLSGSYQQEDDGHDGGITIQGQRASRPEDHGRRARRNQHGRGGAGGSTGPVLSQAEFGPATLLGSA